MTTSAVGHFYRQFSKKRKIKKKQRRNDGNDEVSAAAAASPSLQASASFKSSTSSVTTAATDPPQPTPAAAGDPRVRPPLTANVERAPPWLVADNFVSEQVVCEHLSVVPEPDHAHLVPAEPDDVTTPNAASDRHAELSTTSKFRPTVSPPAFVSYFFSYCNSALIQCLNRGGGVLENSAPKLALLEINVPVLHFSKRTHE